MKKMIGLLMLLCVGLWAADADMADVIQQRTLETHSGTSIQGIFHGKPPVNPDASRDLLWDQASTQYSSFYACQWDSVYPFEAEICDNFELMADAMIESVVWWGGYWGGTPNPPVDFWIKIYPDSGGGNGPMQNPIYSQRVPYAETLIDPGFNYYYYEAVIPPFAATGGVIYWIEFEPTLVFPPQWGNNCAAGLWGDGQELYFKSAFFGVPDWVTATSQWGVPLESSFQLYGSAAAGVTWDFETGWQGWIHTNGLAFPEAWDVQPFDLHSNAMSPDPGDSSMWIDSDAAGSGVTVVDTAWSPAVVPPTNMLWFKYGIGYQNLAGLDTFYVGIREFTGGAWQPPVLLRLYDYDVGAGYWDSVDVSGYSGADSVQVFFAYNDYGAYAWWASFDNVGLYAGPGHDVGCTEITSPPEGGMIAAGDYDVIGRIQNFGGAAETFDVTANVYDTLDAWNLIFTQTVTFTDFPDGGDSLHNFGLVTFAEDKVYYTEIFTLLAGDDNPANDTSAIYSNTVTYDFIWDFEDGWQDWIHTNGLSFPEAWDRLQNPYIWPEWEPPDAGNWTMWIDSDSAYPPNVWVQDTALSPVIVPDVTTEWLRWGVGYWHLGTQFMDVGVKYFDGVNWTAISLRNYTGANYGPDWDSVDVSAYNTYDSLQIFFYFDDDFGWNWLASFDNVMINGYTGISEEPGTHEILVFGFAPHMQNPIKGHAAIGYMTTMPGKVVVKIYDAAGRLIRTLVDKHEPAGAKTVFWNGRDDIQRKVADGVYFLRLEVEDKVDTRKMIFVR
jgi:hypothetical protein